MKKLNPEDKNRIESLRRQVESAMKGSDDYQLQNACEELTQALQAVGRFVDSDTASSEDGAMDADFHSGNE